MNLEDASGYLLPNENLLWSGEPFGGLSFSNADVFLVPFSLLWCGFVIFWEFTATTTNAPFFFRLWGIPFVLAGFYFVVGRFFVDAWVRHRTKYFLTDRRALIVRSAPVAKIISVNLSTLPPVTLTERGNGAGTIDFYDKGLVPNYRSFAMWTPALSSAPSFIRIQDARQVFARIQSLIGKR